MSKKISNSELIGGVPPKKQTKLTDRKQIDNSPFLMVKVDDQWILTFGKYRVLNQIFKSEDEIKTYMENNIWEIIAILSSIIAQDTVTNILNK